MNIHLIGDSHTIMYKGLEPFIKTYHFGACTAYSLLNEHSVTDSFKKLNSFVKEKNPYDHCIIFGFGEIDCRVLIYYKMIEYDISMNDMIDIVIYRYLAAVNFVKNKGFNVIIHGNVPAVLQKNDYNLKYYGDLETRASISWRFNKFLQFLCVNNRIPYYDMYYELPQLVDDNRACKEEFLLPDHVHVDPQKLDVVEKFKTWITKWEIL